MKKKIIFAVTACVFVFATVFSFNMSRQDNISDISLKNIQVMTQANAENPDCPNGCLENGSGCFCFIWYSCYKEA